MAGRLISLYPVWRAAAGLCPHQLSAFLRLPVGAQPAQRWAVCSRITWARAVCFPPGLRRSHRLPEPSPERGRRANSAFGGALRAGCRRAFAEVSRD